MFPASEGVQLFTDFARKHHAAENIEFWLAVNEFKKKKLQGDRLNEATRRIYRTFICNQSEKQVGNNTQTFQTRSVRVHDGHHDFAAQTTTALLLMPPLERALKILTTPRRLGLTQINIA